MARRTSTSSSSTCEVVDVDSTGTSAGEPTGRGRRIRKPTRRDDELVQASTTTRRALTAAAAATATATAGTTKAKRGRPRKVVVPPREQSMERADVDDVDDVDGHDSLATVKSASTVAQQAVELPDLINPIVEVPPPTPEVVLAPMLDPSPSSPPPLPVRVPVDVAPQPKQPVARSSPPSLIEPTEVIILPATSSSQPDLPDAAAPQPKSSARARPPPPQPLSHPSHPSHHHHDSDSDEVDDFFMRRRPAPIASRAPPNSAAAGGKGRRAPMRRPGGGTLHHSASLDPEAANANAGPLTNIEVIEDPGDPALEFGNRKINLPSWARQSSPGKVHGNKKRDRSVSTVPPPAEAKGKWKGKARAEQRDSSSEGFFIARDEEADDVGARKRNKKEGRSGYSSSTGRSRSQSRSLTPPEEVSSEVLQQILRAAHGELGASLAFNSSPSKDDERSRHSSVDSTDADLPPEMHELRSKHSLRAPTQDPTGAIGSSAHEVDVVAPSEMIVLLIRFALQVDLTASASATRWTEPWSMKLGSNAQFGEVFKTLSSRYGLRDDDLVLTFRGRRVYRFGTPRSLKMCGGGEENELRAYRVELWEEVEELRKRRVGLEAEREKATEDGAARLGGEQMLLSEGDDQDEVELVRSNGQVDMRSSPLPELRSSTTGAREPDSPDQDQLIRLTVRGGPKSSFGFAVKPTFPLRKVLAWYCKKAGIVDAKRIARMSLQWDGEKLDLEQTVADIDEFEDEDTLDVKG
ncbi:BZ3500_MvSof-1268-A1-R1_Chr10-4g03109 [Microbotryum saponariae]|uniref:BZ3500_MvSof-1268-A1-R1_Chr10-4g03109 protein n=1 Tax=Microbotryum saponariae TaxID=289078 RepID=A0A2X0L6G3_9BASI|nr:BZ3501_MvSof-1269-A2-R1_Chr10-2g02684 [Microbotryum saponariae]SDA01159.1 BZ3500_MvSof-1268-A1-R1_Chr10-4g03109 [Microbotryum saponariae]